MTESATRRWHQRPAVWIGLALLAAFLAVFGPRLVRLPGLIGQARTELAYWQAVRGHGAQALLQPDALAEAEAHLQTASGMLAAARRDWGFLLKAAPAFGWLPKIGGDLAAAPHLFDAGQAAVEGALPLFQLSKPGLAALSEGAGKALPLLMEAARREPEALAAAEAAFGRALNAWQAVDVTRLSPGLARFAPLLDNALGALSMVPDGLRLLPHLLGADGPKRYLVLAQNSDEMRATGGFISGVGVLEVDGGEIKNLTFGDSYLVWNDAVPHPIPPIALETHMWAQLLVFRDANWWADFPTSAQKARDLYEQDAGQTADGVIAIDTPALQLLVEAVEPVYLEEYDDTITGENLMTRIQEYWSSPAGEADSDGEKDAQWWWQRKQFMGILAQAVMQRLLGDVGDLDPMKLVENLPRLLSERHALFYIPEAQAMLRQARWDGAMVSAPGDYLFVVDSNVGFNKVNPLVEQSILYTVRLDSSQPTAELRIRYTHGSQARLDQCVHESRYGETYQDMMDRCYWDYLRVFVPSGAELLQREGLEDGDLAEPEAGRAVMDGLLVLPPGETREVVFRYRLPAGVLAGDVYTLYVQKQSGTWAVPLAVVVEDAQGVLATFETDLRTDRAFTVPLR